MRPRPYLAAAADATSGAALAIAATRRTMRYGARAKFVVSRARLAVLTSMSRTARSHLRPIGSSRLLGPRDCRTAGCPFKRQGQLGFCPVCEAVYHAAQALRERLLERRGAQLKAARPELFDTMAPGLRERLLAHVAAQGAHHGHHASVLDLAGLEDFLAELRELGLCAGEPT